MPLGGPAVCEAALRGSWSLARPLGLSGWAPGGSDRWVDGAIGQAGVSIRWGRPVSKGDVWRAVAVR
jgi:hypothetical protein